MTPARRVRVEEHNRAARDYLPMSISGPPPWDQIKRRFYAANPRAEHWSDD